MGIADLKIRMRDIPGIDTLTHNIQNGQQVYALNGRTITFGAGDSEATVEQGIRAAIAAPALVQIAAGGPVTPEVVANASAALHPSLSTLPVVSPVPDTPAPAPAPAPSPTAAPKPIDAAHNVKGMLEKHVSLMGDIHAAQLALLDAALQRQRDTVGAAVGNVASKIDSQTDDFMAIMGQFSNSLGGME